MSKFINWHEVSRHLSKNGQNIRPNRVPEKYKRKVNRLIKIVEAWIKWSS